jgi:threonine/homoserine/homoserine lactone efflux protein
MELWAIYLASLVMGFSGAMIPGPMLTIAIKESLQRGIKAGPQLVTGHALLELLLIIAVIFGLGQFFMWPSIQGAIGVIGGLFLFWLSYSILREAWTMPVLDLTAQAGGGSRLHPVVAGVTVSLSNPSWPLWWATAGASSMLLAANYGVSGIISFFVGHISADYIWYTLVSLAVVGGKKLLTPFIYRIILTICALFLLGLAAYFVYSGLKVWGIWPG